MTSNIDPSFPVYGSPTTVSVRNNFQIAQSEITALEGVTAAAPFLPIAGGTMGGTLLCFQDPASAREAATKNYVDLQLSHVGVGTITGVTAGTGLAGGGTTGNVTVSLAVPVSIAHGGTGASTAAQALTALGAAPVSSPAFQGTPTAPSPPANTNNSQVATTAFVMSQIGLSSSGVSSVTAGTGLAGGGTGAVTLSVATHGITNAMLATMPDGTIKGNLSGAVAGPADVSLAQLASSLGLGPLATMTPPIPVSAGGTGASSASLGLANLGGAPLASPALSGVPTAPTAAPDNATGQVATCAFVQNAIAAYPFGGITAVTAGVGLTGGGNAGNVTVSLSVPVSVANGGTGASSAAGALANLGAAPTLSPTFTGIPAAPTAAPGTSTTQLATTQFVAAAISSAGAGVSSVTAGSGLAGGGTGAVTLSIAAGGVTNVMHAAMPAGTVKANTSGASAAPSDVTMAALGTAIGLGSYLPLAGGTLTGPLVLPADPTSALQAATKQYVDAHSAAGGGGTVTSITAGTGLTGGTITTTGTIALAVPVAIASGGTGATTAAAALGALGGAPLVSPAFSGNPQSVTPATGDNSTSIATTAFVKAQGYLTANQPTTLTGDVTGSGTGSIPTTLANSGITAGTFQGITFDAKGRATGATNQSYLTGNQTITLGGDLSGSGATAITGTVTGLQGRAVANTVPSANQVLTWSGTSWGPAAAQAGALTLTGDVTGSGTGSVATTAVRLQGHNVASAAPANLDVLQWSASNNQWQPAAVGGTGTVTSVAAGTGLVASPGPITTTGTMSLVVPVAVANGGTGATSFPISQPAGWGMTSIFPTANGTIAFTPSSGTGGAVGTWGGGSLVAVSTNANNRGGYVELGNCRGTNAAPTASQTGDRLGTIFFDGYGATAWNTAPRAQFYCAASENWTDTAQGAAFGWMTTTPGTTTLALSMQLASAGLVVGGAYVTLSGAAASGVNGSGGPCLYGDNATVVVKMGPSSTNGFWVQGPTGTNLVTVATNGNLTANGQIYSNGTAAGFTFQDRAGGGAGQWVWYSSANVARLYWAGDQFQVDTGGNATAYNFWATNVVTANNYMNVNSQSGYYLSPGGIQWQIANDTNAIIFKANGTNKFFFDNGGNQLYSNGAVVGTGAVHATGTNAGLIFDNRTSSYITSFYWYGTNTAAILYNTTDGDMLRFYGPTNSGLASDKPFIRVDGANIIINATPSGNVLFGWDMGSPQSVYTNGNCLPKYTNAYSSGTSGQAWNWVYAWGFQNVSMASEKRNIVDPPAGALDQVLALKPVSFHWRETEEDADPKHRGFLAGDVREVMGEDFAGYRKDPDNGVETLAYNELVAVLWQAVQELSADVAHLRRNLQ